jgi:hypothetical protein
LIDGLYQDYSISNRKHGAESLTREQRERLSKVQRTLMKLVGNIESIKLMMTDSEGPCEAACYPICCLDCPFGEMGEDIDDEG